MWAESEEIMTNNNSNTSADRRNKVTRTFPVNHYKVATIDMATLTVVVNEVEHIAGSSSDKAFLKTNPQIIEASQSERLYAMDYATFMSKARTVLPNARRDMVTRTFKVNHYKVATIDMATLTVVIKDFEYIAGSPDEKSFLKSNPQIIESTTVESLIGVSYDVFLRYAEEL